MIYYDKFQTWDVSFNDLVEPLIGLQNLTKLTTSGFEFIEDAGSFVSSLTGIELISSEILSWLTKNEFCVFHGTRLLPKEVASIRELGLQPLTALSRQERLSEVFGNHDDWEVVKENLTEVLDDVGPKEKQGRREGQVHFSLSRSGLVNGFDHYLTHGSEFDQHVASRLFPDNSGLRLLQSKTVPYLVHVKMSGEDLVKGAHPHFSYQDVIEMGEVPGLGATFLNAWAFKKSNPNFDIRKLRSDCCVMQKKPTSREKIMEIEELNAPNPML